MLWPVPLSFAGEKDAAAPEATEETAAPTVPVDDIGNVVVETPSEVPAPSEPQPEPEPEPVVPEAPVVPDCENAWPIGADDAVAVVAELWPDGTFVIDGAGDTLAFDAVEDVPWLAAGVADDIKRVIFADKVRPQSLAHWFEGCSNLEEVANVPAGVEDLTRAFYDCPKLVELPDELAFADDAVADACFGFEKPAETLLTTLYRGADENVLAYAWELDGRELVDPDAPMPPALEEPEAPDVAEDPIVPEDAADPEDPETSDELADPETALPPLDDQKEKAAEEPAEHDLEAAVEEPTGENAKEEEPAVPAEEEDPATDEDAQLNITVPSTVSMMLGAEGENTALIPVMAANRSERNVAIVGARLKRADQDLPGGSWSLTTESGSTTFVQDARFTPLGLEATFDRPVLLAAGDESTMLVWHGTFTDHGMKSLVKAAIDGGDSSFAYGSMVWIVAAA